MFFMPGLGNPFHRKTLILFTSKPWESMVIDPRVLLGSPWLYPIGYLRYPEAILACEPNGLCHWLCRHARNSHCPPPCVRWGPGSVPGNCWLWQCHSTVQVHMGLRSTSDGQSGCKYQAHITVLTYQRTCEMHTHNLLLQLLSDKFRSQYHQRSWDSHCGCQETTTGQEVTSVERWETVIHACAGKKNKRLKLTTWACRSAIVSQNCHTHLRNVFGSIAPPEPPTAEHPGSCFGYTLKK